MISRRRLMLIQLGDPNQHYDSDGNPIDTTIPTLSLDITAVNDIMEDTAVPAITLTMELIDA